MNRAYFIKHDQRIRQIFGCDRATLVFDRLEFYSKKQPEGFYKFIEPNSHKLYKDGESWTELLGCHRTSFWRAFKLIGKKHTSLWAFEKAEDKFEGKLYASYYDRLTNRMFFIRNHKVVDEFFTKIQHTSLSVVKSQEAKEVSQSYPNSFSMNNSVRTEQDARSYIEAKKTSFDLSKDKSHAEEIVKKMIEIWTAIVEEGRGQIELTSKRIAYLKQAFRDKFDSCLGKWKKYCQEIASSRFLMGEKTSWRASLDWALKFTNIEKVFDGHYGTADRTPKTILPSQTTLEDEIYNSTEAQETKDFRALCLKTVGTAKYISYFKNLTIEFQEVLDGNGGIVLIAPHKFAADDLERNCYSYLRLILQEFGNKSNNITILAPGETRGRLVGKDRGGGSTPISPPILKTEQPILEEYVEDGVLEGDFVDVSEEHPLESEEVSRFHRAVQSMMTPAAIEIWKGAESSNDQIRF